MGELGQLTGAVDRHGVEIKIGDALRFDFFEWNRCAPRDKWMPCIFVMEYKDGLLNHPGCYSDLAKWCEIIVPYKAQEVEA